MTSFSTADHQYMARAIQLAAKGRYTTHPNPRVGCVIVKDGQIVGEGWHERAGEAHAEVHALMQAAEQASGATAYVSLEPCCHHGRTPPCSQALIQAGVKKVIAAMVDPNDKVAGQGMRQLQQAGIETSTGLLEQQARELNPGFIKRMQTGQPYVRCKMAMSLDGRTAMASGESQWITGAAAREDVQHWRARSDCIMTGIETVLHDDPCMTVRLPEVERQPLRAVIDSKLRMTADRQMLKQDGDTVIFSCETGKTTTGVEVIQMPCHDNRVELSAVLTELGRREINEVHLECGATLSGAMLQAGLVDELLIYVAPVLMGDAARGLFHLPGLNSMADRLHVEIIEQRQVGEDLRLRVRLRTNH